MIKCGLCGKEFEDNQFDEYAAHVKRCAYDHKLKADTEKMKKINDELEEVKRAKVCYEGLRDAFKEKYPDIYAANFKEDNSVNKNKNVIGSNNENNRGQRRHMNLYEDKSNMDDLSYLFKLFDF